MATDGEDRRGTSGGGCRVRTLIAARLKSSPYSLLALILIVAAAVRFVGIGQQSFSSDEIAELRVAHSTIGEILRFGDGVAPLYNLLVHIFLPLGDLAGRVLSALFGLGTVCVTWAWARRIAGLRAGVWAAWLVTLSPLAIQLSTEGRAYGLMALLTATALWSLWVALDEPSPLHWARWGMVSALGIYSHYLFAILVVASLIVVLVEARGRPSRAVWLGLGTLALLTAPVIAVVPADFTGQMSFASGAGLVPAELAYAGYRLFAGLYLGPSLRDLLTFGSFEAVKAVWMWVLLLAPPVALLLVQGYRALSSSARRRFIGLTVLSLVLELAAIQVTRMGFGASYITWLVAPLAVFLGAGLAHLRRPWRWASATVLLVVAGISIVTSHLDPHHQVDDAKGVAAYLQSSGALDYPVLVSSTTRVRPIVYYLDRTLALSLPDRWDGDTGRLGYYTDEGLPVFGLLHVHRAAFRLAEALEHVAAHTRPGEPYYLVYTEPFYCDPHGDLLAVLTSRDGLTLEKSFAGMDIYRGVRRG